MFRIVILLALIFPALAAAQIKPPPPQALWNMAGTWTQPNRFNGAVSLGGAPQGNNLWTTRGTTYQTATNTQPSADFFYNTFNNLVSYTADAVGGDSVGSDNTLLVSPNGHTVGAPQHITPLYGACALNNDGSAASVLTWCNGIIAASGNSGPGTLTNGVDIRGHADFSTGGGTFTNHYYLYQEPSSAATHEYGGYLSGPLGIGQSAPAYNLEVAPQSTGGLSTSLWAKFGSGTGTMIIQSNGICIFPAGCQGAGSIAAPVIEVGAASLTASTGELAITKNVASGVAPGALGGKIALVCGTGSGTAKLIAYSGTSATPATILDNIGGGVTGC